MSTTGLSDYLEAAKGDAAEAAALGRALEGRTGAAAREAFAERARAGGHDVERADVEALEAVLAGEEGEMDDAALEGVAGGCSLFNDVADWMSGIGKAKGKGSPRP